MPSIINCGLRGFLLLCGGVVLGLSVTLAKQQVYGSVPAQTGFGSFTGAFGIVASFVGIAALMLDAIPDIVAVVVDALAAIFYLAGGIALAIAMKGVSCTADDAQAKYNRAVNSILSGGCVGKDEAKVCGFGIGRDAQQANTFLKHSCVRAEADFAFEFIACAFGLGVLALSFFHSRRSGRTTYV